MSSTSQNSQAKADFKARTAIGHQSPGSGRKKPDPIQINLPSLPKIPEFDLTEQTLSLAATAMTLGSVAVWAIPPLNHAFRSMVNVGSTVTRYAEEAFGDLGFTPTVGDKVSGYDVTSGYGKREAPCEGCSTNHPAIDIAMPIGTHLYAPHKAGGLATMGHQVQVNCRKPSQTGGGGLVAEVLIPERQVIYQLLHLKDCQAGTPNGGTAIARSGDSGIGTGAHLDLRKAETDAESFEELERPLQYTEPTMFEAMWIVNGLPPKAELPE